MLHGLIQKEIFGAYDLDNVKDILLLLALLKSTDGGHIMKAP